MATGIRGAFLFGPQKRYKLTLITRQIFLAHACFMAAAYVLLGPSLFMDLRGVAWVVALDVLMYFALRRAGSQNVSHVLMLAWFLLMFFLPRVTAFLVFPARQITFPAMSALTADEISTGMMFIVPGTAAILAGFWLGGRFGPKRQENSFAVFPLSGIAVYWAFCFAAGFYVFYILQITIFGDPANWGSPMGWTTRIFDTDAALLILICWIVVRGKPTRPESIFAAILILMWLAMSLWFGSRGGPLRLLLLLGMTAIAVYGDVALTLRRFTAVLVICIAASALAYPAATVIRYDKGTSSNPVGDLVSRWSQGGPVKETQDEVSALRWAFSSSPVVQKIARVTAPVVTRLGLVDYPLYIINRQPDQAAIDRYLSPLYSAKKFINNMVPGDLFPNNDIMSSRIFTMAYRGYDENHVRTTFLSEPWTIWGYAWIQSGPIGGMFLIAMLAAIVQAGFHILCRIVGPDLAPYTASAWLFVPGMSGLLQLFGLDHWLTITAHFYIAMSIAALLMVGSRWLKTRFAGGQRKQPVEHRG